jgi:hypothetical protein
MDRFVNQDGMDFQKNTVNVDLVFVAGTSGAVPSTFKYSDGVASVTKSGTTYIIQFQDSYVDFLNLDGTAIQASFAASGASYAIPVAAAVSSATAPTLTIAFLSGADGTQVALASGDEAHITVRLKR